MIFISCDRGNTLALGNSVYLDLIMCSIFTAVETVGIKGFNWSMSTTQVDQYR